MKKDLIQFILSMSNHAKKKTLKRMSLKEVKRSYYEQLYKARVAGDL